MIDRMGMSLVPILGVIVWCLAVGTTNGAQRKMLKATAIMLLMVALGSVWWLLE